MTMKAKFVSIALASALSAVGAYSANAADVTDPNLGSEGMSGGIFASAEALFMTPTRSDGTGNLSGIMTDTFTARYTVGYKGPSNAGIRLQYWSFDDSDARGVNNLRSAIDTEVRDVEFFKKAQVTDDLMVEFSGGVRFVDYDDQNWADNSQRTKFEGWGGVVGVKGYYDLGFWDVSLYGSGTFAFLTGEGIDNTTVEKRVTRSITEIAAGIQKKFMLGDVAYGKAHVGYEWQFWEGFQDNADGDIGFSGYTAGAGIYF